MNNISTNAIWTLTNGMAGFEIQTNAIATELAQKLKPPPNSITRKTISLALPYRLLAPYGPAHQPADCMPPYPDILIASGRKSIPLARHIKRASADKCFTIVLQNPHISPHHFDFVWSPAHDLLKGENVYTTLLSPHGLTTDNLAQAAKQWKPKLLAPPIDNQNRTDRLTGKLIGVLIGGANKIYPFSNKDIKALLHALRTLADAGHYLMISLSQRTPKGLEQALVKNLSGRDYFLWSPKTGTPNPYRGILGLANALIVTCDSVNMVGEACVSGAAVYVYPLHGGSKRFERFHKGVYDTTHAAPLDAKVLTTLTSNSSLSVPLVKGINATPKIADKIIDAIRKREKNSL